MHSTLQNKKKRGFNWSYNTSLTGCNDIYSKETEFVLLLLKLESSTCENFQVKLKKKEENNQVREVSSQFG